MPRRSASDALSVFEPDYVWHDLAQTWQTPGDGEASLDEMFAGTPAERAERLQAFGIGRPEALQIAQSLEQAGRLAPSEHGMIEEITQALGAIP